MPQKTNLAQRARAAIGRWLLGSQSALRRFEGARVDRLTSDWLATRESINQELRADLDRLRARGRELVKNNDYARKFVGMCQNNIVGPAGFQLQVRIEDKPGQPDELASTAIETAFAQWAAGCDLTGTMSLRDVCDTLVGGLPSDGEFLVRFVRGAEAGNRFNFAVQLIDVDRIDTTYHGQTKDGNRIVMGVERDVFSRPVALHLYDGHPNDGEASNRNRTRVPVAELLHRYKVDTPGQARGIPWMAPGMLSLHHLGGFKLAALLAAEHGANHYGFFVREDGAPAIGETDAATQQTITTSQPGVYDTLPAGTQFIANESKYPNDVFGPFVKVTLQRIASGWRVAYHSLANDLEGVSYSSIRSGTLEERDRWAADQAWFIGAFLEPLYSEWIRMALLSGAITMPNGSALPSSKLAKFSAHQWQGRRWEWVDPRNDIEAKILAVKAGLMAPQDLAAQLGQDFNDTMGKIKAAQDLAQRLGIRLPAYEDTAQPAAQPQQDKPLPEPEAAKLLAARQAQPDHLAAVAAAMTAMARREAPAVTVNAPITVTTPEVRNQVNVPQQAAPVVQVPITVQEREQAVPVINVAAPVVNVAAPAVDVSVEAVMPAQSEVAIVSMPNRQTLSSVERDGAGAIVNTTQVETDI